MNHQKHVEHATHAKWLLVGNVFQNALPPKKIAKLLDPQQDSAPNFHLCLPSYAFSPAAREAVFCVPSLFVVPFTCFLVNIHANMLKPILAFETLCEVLCVCKCLLGSSTPPDRECTSLQEAGRPTARAYAQDRESRRSHAAARAIPLLVSGLAIWLLG